MEVGDQIISVNGRDMQLKPAAQVLEALESETATKPAIVRVHRPSMLFCSRCNDPRVDKSFVKLFFNQPIVFFYES